MSVKPPGWCLRDICCVAKVFHEDDALFRHLPSSFNRRAITECSKSWGKRPEYCRDFRFVRFL